MRYDRAFGTWELGSVPVVSFLDEGGDWLLTCRRGNALLARVREIGRPG